MQGLLQVKNLETGYGLIKVLWGVDLEVFSNECVILLGVNGAGKTTLLRTIVGLLKVWKGEIIFDSENITKVRPNLRISRGIAYMSELAIFPNLTVEENLKLGGYFHSDKENRLHIEEMYKYFPDLEEHKHRMAGALSGGQRKMLGVAKIFMADPKLIIMDEPSSGLSPKFVKRVIEVLSQFYEKKKTSMLIAEQNISFLSIADRAYVLDKGKITFEGTVSELEANDKIREAYFGVA